MSDNKTFSMPRVIFADERDESLIPPGVIMAIALQQAGYKIKPGFFVHSWPIVGQPFLAVVENCSCSAHCDGKTNRVGDNCVSCSWRTTVERGNVGV